MEIEHPLFKDSGMQVEVINKITRMLGVQFQDEEDRKNAGGEWIAFCQSFRLTAPEIVEAYTMALRKELYANGEPIKVFPNLSVITAGEILKAYEEYKIKSQTLEQGRKKLNEAINPPKEETAEEKQEKRLIFLKNSFKEYLQTGEMKGVILFYDKIRNLYPKISIDFVEHFLIKFKAEEPQKSESVGGMMPYKMVKNDAFVKFKETYVYAFLEKMEMKNYTEQQWIDYWEN